MNWGRVKTILIIMFLTIDIVLLGLFFYINNDINYIKKDTVKETINVLKKHNIIISEEIIPKQRVEKKIINYENVIYTPQKAAQRFLGENFETISENESGIIYKKGSMFLTLSDGKMLLENRRNKNIAQNFDEVKKQVLNDLETFGYKKNEIGFEKAVTKEGICHITAYQTFDDKKIYGTQLIITADKDGILTLEGKCFSFTDKENTKEKLKDVTTVLVDMIYEPSFKGIEINKIEVIYYINPEYIDASNVLAYPVYVIKDTDGREFILE